MCSSGARVVSRWRHACNMVPLLEKQMHAGVVRDRILLVALALAMLVGHGRAQASENGYTSEVAFNKVTEVIPLSNGIELHDGSMVMCITALRDDVLRIRASRTETLP